MSATFMNIIKITSNVFSCCSRGLGFTIIVFLTTQYFKSKSNHRSAYFVILNVGYAMDFILFVNWVIPIPFGIYTIISINLEWYIVYFTTIWNFVLCLNRCTALVLFTKYDRIWRPLTMLIIIILMIAFPFIVDGSSFFTTECAENNILSCLSFRTQYYLKGTIMNVILNGIGISLIVLSMFKSSKDKFKANSTHAKTERKLIYQAIFSSIFQLFSFALKYFTASISDYNVYFSFMFFSDIVYHFQHLVVMGTHFILSPTFKAAYLEFYHLKFLLSKRNTILISHKSMTGKSVTPTVRTITA